MKCIRKTPLILALIAVIVVPLTTLDVDASPQKDWMPIPEGEISCIAFGSCTRQMQDAPLLNTVVDAKPDLFLMLGDVIYPDINDEGTALLDPWPTEETLPRIKQVYA